MRNRVLVAFLLLMPSLPALADCQLQNPVPIGSTEFWKIDADESQKPFVIENAVFDQPIKSEMFDQRYAASPKVVELFSLLYVNSEGRHRIYEWPAASARPDVCGNPFGCAHGAGFTWGYGGVPPRATGSVIHDGAKTVFTTTLRSIYNGNSAEAIDQLIITIERNAITALQMVIPTFEKRVQDGVTYYPFTGENQTLCLVSGRARPR